MANNKQQQNIPGENHRKKETAARQAVKHLARHIANILPPVVRPAECSAVPFSARPFVCYALTHTYTHTHIYIYIPVSIHLECMSQRCILHMSFDAFKVANKHKQLYKYGYICTNATEYITKTYLSR